MTGWQLSLTLGCQEATPFAERPANLRPLPPKRL
jgi:hypothetical protein